MRESRPPAFRGRSLGSGFGAPAALLLATWLAAALSACRPEPSARSRPPDQVTTGTVDSLRFELLVPAEVPAGDSVPIVLQLTNARDRPVEAHFLGRTIAFDIVVARAEGEVVWRRLLGAAIQGILQVRILAPGETLELRDVWDQRMDTGAPAGPGDYTVQGLLPTDEPEPLRTPVVRLRLTEGR